MNMLGIFRYQEEKEILGFCFSKDSEIRVVPFSLDISTTNGVKKLSREICILNTRGPHTCVAGSLLKGTTLMPHVFLLGAE